MGLDAQYDMPLHSVIVANYNNAKYLTECLDSILSQTYKNIEIVVADDCSTDNSIEIIDNFKNKYPDRIVLLRSNYRKGVSETRHNAIIHAKGDYISTLDSDDMYLTKNKIWEEMNLILKYKRETSTDVIAYSGIVKFLANGKSKETHKTISEGNIFNTIISMESMIPRDYTYKKEIYHEVGGYDKRLTTHEDHDLVYRLSSRYMFYYTGIDGIYYRRHPDGLSSLTSIRIKNRNIQKVFKKNISITKNTAEKKQIIKNYKKYTNTRNEKLLRRRIVKNTIIKRLFFRLNNFGIKYCFEYYLRKSAGKL